MGTDRRKKGVIAMFLDWLLWGGITFGVAILLNKFLLNEKPLSKGIAILLSIGFFIITVVFLSYGKSIRYESFGGTPSTPYDQTSPAFAFLFYSSLNKKLKIK